MVEDLVGRNLHFMVASLNLLCWVMDHSVDPERDEVTETVANLERCI